MNKKKVLLGMSGGVDSSVSAILLKQQGYEVYGLTMLLCQDSKKGNQVNQAALDAKHVCDILGIPHEVVDLTEEFNTHVITPFINQYQIGRTPNPCIECNKYLKFGAMYQKAQELGMDFIATGHYAKIVYSPTYGQYVLTKSASISKDQSYVLYQIPKEILPYILFPLGDFETKDQIREIARNYPLDIASKADSQEICFIPDNNYIGFLEQTGKLVANTGDIVTTSGKILGKHKGLHCYTIGQRKGLGLDSNDKLYVTRLDAKQNRLVVGSDQDILSKELYAEQVHLLIMDRLIEPLTVMVKIRYAAMPVEATIYPLVEGKMKIVLSIPTRAVTPGQSIVFYLGEVVLGGAKITEVC